MSGAFQDVWKIAFLRHPELPKCPPRLDYSTWAFLLFGRAICMACGEYGAMTDFAFCQRYCQHCMTRNYRYFRDLRDSNGEHLSLDHPVVSMVPHSFRINAHTYTFAPPVIWRARVLKIMFDDTMKKVTLLRILIDHGFPELTEILNAYTASRISYVSQHHAAAENANGWAIETYKSWMRERQSDFKSAIYRCDNQMKSLGYDPRDIKNAWPFISGVIKENAVRKLTSKGKKLEPTVKGYVRKSMLSRLKSERVEYLSGLYTAYQKTQLPEKWPFFPPSYLISTSEIFYPFLHSEVPYIGVVELEDVALLFERLARHWEKIHQLQLTGFLRSDGAMHQLNDIKQFDSATLIVSCLECEKRNCKGRVLVGWDTILGHFSGSSLSTYRSSCSTYRYNAPISTFACALLQSVGLDPCMTTVQDMDCRKDRFLCGNCTPTATSRGILSLKVFTWHEFMSHQTDMVHLGELSHCRNASWRILTPEAIKFVLAQERAHPLPVWKAWCCNHCSMHYEGGVTQQVAIGHVKETFYRKAKSGQGYYCG
ncbi:hypothetical protein JR316_0010314 [Psilocybe cubensis]|nr:hypothetical protein JR316_0010314 [Psilocybe cubensis]KAH9478077.1 hypothetical protein JR316_0010314 [Psilocybe cubensis]